MKLIALTLFAAGIVVMVIAAVKWFKLLSFMRQQVYEKQLFSHRSYPAAFILILFFILSYINIARSAISTSNWSETISISALLFLGALFVLTMIVVLKTLLKTIMAKLNNTFAAMIEVLEARDPYTKGHSEHVRNLTLLLWEHLPTDTKRRINPTLLSDAAYLHDIGKISISDTILKKSDKLSEEEWEIMRTHPHQGKAMLDKTGFDNISTWVLYHHERVDGKGYYGIGGNEIPIEAKMIAIIDTFSALYTDRVYRAKLPYKKAINKLPVISGVPSSGAFTTH